MTTKRVNLHPSVPVDIAEIELSLAEVAGAETAAEYSERLYDFCYSIGEFPDAGRTHHYDGVEIQTRTFQRTYQVVYTHRRGHVIILEVHHTAMSQGRIQRRVDGRL